MLRKLLCLLLLGVCFSQLYADNVQHYRLPNGLQIFVKPDKRVPVVFSSIWYKVGGSYEEDGITGISHVLEHMMFRGTPKYGPGRFAKLITEAGGELNAATAADFTLYYEFLPSDQLATALRLEADRLTHLTLAAKEFHNEMKVVMQERHMRVDDNPRSQVYEHFMALAFLNNPYHHPVIGWKTDLLNMQVKDVRRWYHTWYVPNNALLVVVGDVKPAKVYDLAKKYFGPIPRRKVPVLKPRKETALLGKRQLKAYLNAKNPWLIMGYPVPALTQTKKQWQPYALLVLSAILDGGDSARLPQDLIYQQQIASGVNVDYSPFSLHNTLFTFSGIPTPKNSLLTLKKAFLVEIKRVRTTLASPSELERIKAQVIAGNIFAKDSLRQQAYEIGMREVIGLPWESEDAFVKNIQAVTAKQIRFVAKTYLQPGHLTVAYLYPKSAKVKSRSVGSSHVK